MVDKNRKATLTIDGRSWDLPMRSPTVGPDVIDIRKLYGEADVFTYDPGFTSTASCASTITYIDGDAGELLYRGYPIEQLAERSHFLEVCFLLLYGDLPNAAQLEDFENLTISNEFQELTGIARIHDWGSYVFPVEFFDLQCRKPWFGDEQDAHMSYVQRLVKAGRADELA